MIPKTLVLMALVVVFLAMPGVVGHASAAAFPDYFADEWVGFVCVNSTPPGSGPVRSLLQLNFDKSAFGGIPLPRADALFAYLTSNLGLLSPVIGPNAQIVACTPQISSLSPSQVIGLAGNVNALQAAQQLSGIFQQPPFNFPRYYIVDAFLSFTVLYFGSVDTLRTENYRVNGSNDQTYVSSNEIAVNLVP